MKNLLSMVGRLTLVNSVLVAVGIHVMPVLPNPKGLLKKMDSLIANFLRGQGTNKKHHWVSFSNICRPKEVGGLGIRRLKDHMKAFQGKLAWYDLQQQSLWAKFAKTRFTLEKSGSLIWRVVSKQILILRNRTYWEVGDGNTPIDKYCWHFGIPCNSSLKGITIKEVLDHPRRRCTFLDGVPNRIKYYYRYPCFSPGEISLKWI